MVLSLDMMASRVVFIDKKVCYISSLVLLLSYLCCKGLLADSVISIVMVIAYGLRLHVRIISMLAILC